MLNSILAGTMLFSSFAVRTPNTQPNPDDYEVSIGFSNDHYYVNRQWERELGEKYIDDLFWAKFDNGFYFKPEYMDKESQSVKYLKLDWRRSYKGFTAGFTTRSTTYDRFSICTYILNWFTCDFTIHVCYPINKITTIHLKTPLFIF